MRVFREFFVLLGVFHLGYSLLNLIQLGGFDIRTGIALHPKTAYSRHSQPSRCRCQMSCKNDGQCISYSGKTMDDYVECYLFKNGTTAGTPHHTLIQDKDGFLGTLIVPGASFGSDGMHYYHREKTSANYAKAKEDCATVSGYHLVQPKKMASLHFMDELCGGICESSIKHSSTTWYAVDITREGTGNWVFGDGTPLLESEAGKSVQLMSDAKPEHDMMTYYNKFFDPWYKEKDPIAVFCQANFIGIMY